MYTFLCRSPPFFKMWVFVFWGKTGINYELILTGEFYFTVPFVLIYSVTFMQVKLQFYARLVLTFKQHYFQTQLILDSRCVSNSLMDKTCFLSHCAHKISGLMNNRSHAAQTQENVVFPKSSPRYCQMKHILTELGNCLLFVSSFIFVGSFYICLHILNRKKKQPIKLSTELFDINCVYFSHLFRNLHTFIRLYPNWN